VWLARVVIGVASEIKAMSFAVVGIRAKTLVDNHCWSGRQGTGIGG